MRLAVFQRGVRDVYEVDGTLMLGGDWNHVEPDGEGIWRARFWDRGTSYELQLIAGSLATYVDKTLVDRDVRLFSGMEIAFGAIRILVDYDTMPPPSPALTTNERELLQRIAEGDDDAATVLADYWGDARGAFVTAQRAGVESEPDPAWLATIRSAGFAGACTRGFAVPLALEEGEPLLLDADALRISPRRYLIGPSIQPLLYHATAAGPNDELERVVLKLGEDSTNAGRMLARFDHPNIVRYLGPVEHRRGFGFAMAWAGVSVWRIGRISDDAAIAIGLQLCEALRALAKARVVHQRIRGSCVMIDGDRVALGGFEHAGTSGLSYMLDAIAPEQISGGAVSSATDLYAVAVLMVEKMTGRQWSPGWSGIFGSQPLIRLLRRTLVDEPARRPSLDEFASSLAAASSPAGSSSRP